MRRKNEAKTFYLIITPWILMFLFLNVFPMGYGLYLSLTRFDGISPPRFSGFSNYLKLFSDYRFLNSILSTLKFTSLNIILTLIVGFFLANLLNRDIRAKGFFRSILFIPYTVPVIATVFIWKTLFNRESGLISILLSLFNPNFSINILVDLPTFTLVMMFVWQVGSSMVVFLAGLQSIPKELLDAAHVDGAGSFFIQKNITIPLMSPIILYQAVVGIMLSFSVIVQPILLTSSPGSAFTAFLNQQPPFQNYFTIIYAFQQCFTNQSFGYGMAVVWLMFVFMLVLTFVFLKLIKRFVYYENE
ncbi:MAG: sugar ABC transporter permease [Spirochaetales bacterium]|nr:MAG: sugar ABC transporter permease [Spirochaetales bacterium]